MFFFFPAGLVLYWLINNMLSIAQQWYVTKQIANAKPAGLGAVASATTKQQKQRPQPDARGP